jgi:VIT1/CCC1 family predicted Fe2+/Mn2+ transporter
MDTVRKRHWWNFERRSMNNIFTLEQWIAVATINLTPTAISSITREITDHYQTSLEKYEARGISSIEAEGLAVRDLGSPKVAARGFEREYLTKNQVRRFLPESKQTIGLKIMLVVVWVTILGLFFLDFRFRYPTLFAAFSLYFLGMTFFLTIILLFDSVSRALLQRNRGLPIVASVMVIEYFSVAIGIVVWYFFAPAPFKIPTWTFLTFMTFLTVGMAYTELPILQKLRTRASR